jgi:hypothetical protein
MSLLPRRGALSAAGAAALFAGLTTASSARTATAPDVPASRASRRDAALLLLCAAHAEAYAEIQRIDATPGGVPEVECTAALDRFHGLVDQLGELPARTAEGVRAKAHALRLTLAHLVKVDTDESVEKGGQPEDLLAWSLIHDILGRG